jgi:ABC-type uncharacterized transport system permease subunit
MPPEPVIQVRQLTKDFKVPAKSNGGGRLRRVWKSFFPDLVPFRAIDGIELAVQPGEFIGYIGPNGSGKSTTIKCLTGVLTPTAGEVWGMAFMASFLSQFLSGFTIPLWIFPDWLAQLALALPFHFLFYTPAQALLAGMSTEEFLLTLGQELLWIVLMAMGCRALWEAGRRKFCGHGT